MPLGEWGSHERKGESGAPPKNVILPILARLAWKWLQIGTDMLLIITSTGVELLRNVNIDDLEWPWTFKMADFSKFFFAISGCDTHFGLRHAFQEWIAPQSAEIDQNNLQMKFSALDVDFSSPSLNPLRSRRVAQAGSLSNRVPF